MIGYSLVAAFSTYVQSSAFEQAAGATPASRAAFARSMGALAAQLSYLLPPPHRLDTLAGYVAWRSYGSLPLILMVWAIASAAGAVRGDEEKQLVDSWLAQGVSRARLVAGRLAAFAAASLVACAVGGVFALLGAARVDPLGLGPVAGQTLALWLFAVTSFSLCYLVAQLASTTRGAQAGGAALMMVLYICNVLGRTQHSLDWLAWASPFRWYDATDVLPPGGHLDVVGLVLSLATALAAAVLSALAFARRDLRRPLFPRRVSTRRARQAAPSPLLTWPVGRLLYRQRSVLLGWGAIVAVLAVFMVSLARGTVDSLNGLPAMHAWLTRGSGGDPYRGFIATFWFGIAQLLLAGFAIHIVSIWGADDTEGILAAELSTPRHRWAVLAERAVAAVFGIALLAAAGSLLTGIAAAASGTRLDAAGVFQASWLLIPFALTFAAVGAVADAEWPRAVVGVLGALAFLSYMIYELAPLLNWPSWLSNLSVFQLYGTPLLTGVNWAGLWAMLAIVVVGFGLATVLMQRREVVT